MANTNNKTKMPNSVSLNASISELNIYDKGVGHYIAGELYKIQEVVSRLNNQVETMLQTLAYLNGKYVLNSYKRNYYTTSLKSQHLMLKQLISELDNATEVLKHD